MTGRDCLLPIWNMEKIVRIDFKAKRREEAAPDRSAEAPPNDGVFTETHVKLRLFNFAMGPEGRAGKLMKLQVTSNSLRIARERVGGYSTGELMDWLERSTEHDWVARPALFQTIYSILRERVLPSPSTLFQD